MTDDLTIPIAHPPELAAALGRIVDAGWLYRLTATSDADDGTVRVRVVASLAHGPDRIESPVYVVAPVYLRLTDDPRRVVSSNATAAATYVAVRAERDPRTRTPNDGNPVTPTARPDRATRIAGGIAVALIVALIAVLGASAVAHATPKPDAPVTTYQVAVTARRVDALIYRMYGYRTSNVAAACRPAPGENWYGGHGACIVAATVTRHDVATPERVLDELVQVRAVHAACRAGFSVASLRFAYPLAGHPGYCLRGAQSDVG